MTSGYRGRLQFKFKKFVTTWNLVVSKLERMADIDSILIERILEGDKKSVEKLIERYRTFAYTLSIRVLHNKEEAEEAAQDAFVKALQALPKFERQSKFKTWFFRIVHNTAVSYVRKRRVDHEPLKQGMDTPDYSTNVVGNIEQNERKKIINAAIAKLKPNDATLVTLYYFRENNLDEIAEIMNDSPGNLKVKLFRARKKLAMALAPEFENELKTLP